MLYRVYVETGMGLQQIKCFMLWSHADKFIKERKKAGSTLRYFIIER
jgi:hypothetical protein